MGKWTKRADYKTHRKELVALKVAAIVAGTDATRAAKAIATSVPIIFVTGAEPVATGLVWSINRPGGNITGVSFNALPVTGKRLELLRQLVPKAELIAVLQDPTYVQHQTETSLIETAARTLGQKIITFKTGSEQEIDAAFPAIAKSGAGALFVGVGQVFTVGAINWLDLLLFTRFRPASRSLECCRRRTRKLWREPDGRLPPRWCLCRSRLQRRKAGRSSS